MRKSQFALQLNDTIPKLRWPHLGWLVSIGNLFGSQKREQAPKLQRLGDDHLHSSFHLLEQSVLPLLRLHARSQHGALEVCLVEQRT